jgi:succinoglycan biosynthesis transport protein ExoP
MSNAASDRDDRLINIDILGALRRRKWIGLIIGVIGVTATVTIVKTWPATYQSTATILIEEPDVPADLVKSTVSTFANDRLQVIQQRVMTSQHLNEIIDRFDLYPEEQKTMPRSALINMMRSQVDLEVVSANLSGQPQQQQRRPQQPQASIAFTLSFASEDPNIAQQVANRLTDLYLAENDRTRQEKAAGTTQFLGEQAQKLYGDVQTLEKRLLDLRSKYNGSLPEQFAMNTQLLNQAQAQVMQLRSDQQMLSDKKTYLQSQIGTMSPYTPMTSNGRPATPQAQLMDLELQYSDLSGRYGAKHPDVVRLQRQIEVMRNQIGGVDTRALDQAKFSTVQAQLNEATQRYGEKHPEVQRLRRQLEEMKAQMDAAPAPSITPPAGPPDNPMYLQLQNQLADADSQLRGLNERAAALDTNIAELQKRILQTPTVEAEYSSLQSQHQVALQRYQNFKDKEADAQVAETMEQQSKGETFSVIEPPQYPDVPVRPNRRLLMAVGVFMTAMLAAAAMVAIDMLDPRIYEPKSLMAAFGEMPLATVPYIRTNDELRGRRLRMIGVASVAAILMAGLLVFGF